MLCKVRAESLMYKMGVRWMQYMESESAGKHDANYLVLDHLHDQ